MIAGGRIHTTEEVIVLLVEEEAEDIEAAVRVVVELQYLGTRP